MLVLSRKSGEQINIGEDITIEIRRVAGNRVTIALHAPREVRILRGELKQAAEDFEADGSEQPEATAAAVSSVSITDEIVSLVSAAPATA